MMSNESYKGKITHYSGFLIENNDDFGFSADDYSKFKHGAENIARKFGYELAERFIRDCFKDSYTGKQIVIVPSAYSYIPTASFFMMRYFVQRLNMYLYENGFPVVQETKIVRSVTYREDYGEMSAEDRYNLISGDKFHIDKTFLGDKVLLFLDDIKITGTHERIIIKMLNEYGISNDSYMLYFAELVNQDISPKFENYLNNHSVSGLDDIEKIITGEDFTFNTRVVKYILNASPEKFDQFIERRTPKFVSQLLFNSIGNEYYKFDSYIRNINKLKELTSINI
ncbi:phosphoribosyltransferase family protein [Dysgonomonas macrotermitis]|uniref:PRTase ComF-like n=1 Tax=Dysgonomonas macrotermitis TaxID=1346286 RepID=A0A1M4ZIH3_9BACT|nr:phosphoribosyltransferase family protein [Dysgonomonas macrotermitis]SHF17592.1 PRTase ComF-like [Dysgonomonas macrotermitis]